MNVYTGVGVLPPGRSRPTQGSRAWGLLTAPMPGPQAVRPRGPSYPPPARPPHAARGQAAGLGLQAERPPLGPPAGHKARERASESHFQAPGRQRDLRPTGRGARGPQGSMTFNPDAPPAPEAAGMARLHQLGTTPPPQGPEIRQGGGVLQERLASGLPGQGDHLR